MFNTTIMFKQTVFTSAVAFVSTWQFFLEFKNEIYLELQLLPDVVLALKMFAGA